MMEWFNILRARLRALFRRESVLQDIEEELRVHIEMETETNIKRGMPPDEARAAAMKSFGNLSQNTELGYDIRGGGWLETLWQDLRYAARGMRKHAVLSTVVIATLALGIGISTGVFTFINAIVLRARVDKDPDTFVRVFSPDISDPARPGILRGLTVADYLAFRDGTRSLRDVTAWRTFGPSVEDDRSGVSVVLTTDNYFSLYTAKRPRLGRFLQPADFKTNIPVAVLSERFWRDRFAADPEIVGKAVRFNRQPVTVIGVAQPFANMNQDTAAWLPYTLLPYLKLGGDPGVWEIEGRLNAGFSRQDAAAELALLNSQQDRLHPGRKKSAIFVTDGSMVQQPHMQNRLIWVIFLIMGILTLVVIIACVNVTTLLLARAHARRQEIVVRLALGAGKLRLVRMLLVETLLLAAIAGLASLAFTYLFPDILNRWLVITPFDWQLTPDWRVFGYLAALTLLAGLLAGLAPALQSLKVNLSDDLKGRQNLLGRTTGRGWLRGVLIVTQVAVSLFLLVGASLLVWTNRRAKAADFGFETRQVLAANQGLRDRVNPGQTWVAHHLDLAQRIAAMPGVQSVAFTSRAPFDAGGTPWIKVQSVDRPALQVSWSAVSPGYFATLGIPLLSGRALQESDPPCRMNHCSVVVSESLAREFWPSDNPLGKTLRTEQGGIFEVGQGAIFEVVGIAREISSERPGQTDNPWIYLPWDANAFPHSLLARFTGDGASLAQAVTATIRAMDSELTIDTRTIQSHIDNRFEGLWKLELLVEILGVLAVALAIMGIYGLVSFAVSQRTREIGIRIALGARRQDIFFAVLSSSVRPIAVGIVAGLLLAFAGATLLARATRFSPDAPFILNAHDFIPYSIATMLLAAVIFAAMLGPARRAMKVDPMIVLRSE
jgi:putative ABC transport system permease protein